MVACTHNEKKKKRAAEIAERIYFARVFFVLYPVREAKGIVSQHYLYSWADRGTVRMKCFAQEHNTRAVACLVSRSLRFARSFCFESRRVNFPSCMSCRRHEKRIHGTGRFIRQLNPGQEAFCI